MQRLVVGISGASGAMYGIRLLQAISDTVETHLVVSRAAAEVISRETSYRPADVEGLATRCYRIDDLCAPLSSGSYPTDGMVVVPCSIKTLSSVANAHADTLLTRAADVTLKQGRRLVLVVRESPLHVGHLQLMTRAARMGAIIAPPVPAFYGHPTTVRDIVDHTVGRILDLFGIKNDLVARWGETAHGHGRREG
ncbi:MAG: UbiX family flavin prenyltransferase [Chitinivibrionales bacterium]|nr:UbiX family flavin prenyltransferase [Chitinivibrionales bacterium]